MPISPPQQLCSGVNNYGKGLWSQRKKKITQPQLPKPHSRSGTLGYTRIFNFFSPPLNKMSKMYLMRSSPVTNEAVICQKGKICKLRAHPLTPCQQQRGAGSRRGRSATYSGRGELSHPKPCRRRVWGCSAKNNLMLQLEEWWESWQGCREGHQQINQLFNKN